MRENLRALKCYPTPTPWVSSLPISSVWNKTLASLTEFIPVFLFYRSAILRTNNICYTRKCEKMNLSLPYIKKKEGDRQNKYENITSLVFQCREIISNILPPTIFHSIEQRYPKIVASLFILFPPKQEGADSGKPTDPPVLKPMHSIKT